MQAQPLNTGAPARHIRLQAAAGEVRRFISGGVALAEGRESSWVTITRTGSFTDPRYGRFEITRALLEQVVSNFDAGGADLLQRLSDGGGNARYLGAGRPTDRRAIGGDIQPRVRAGPCIDCPVLDVVAQVVESVRASPNHPFAVATINPNADAKVLCHNQKMFSLLQTFVFWLFAPFLVLLVFAAPWWVHVLSLTVGALLAFLLSRLAAPPKR